MVVMAHTPPNQRLRRYSPRKDSPSRQLNFELDTALEQLVIHDHECKKLHAYQRRAHHEDLEARDSALAKSHMAALEAASARHEAVRQEAEAILQRHLREQEDIRLRKEAEERARQEREAREKAERERKARDEAERRAREERQRREAEELKAKQEAEDRVKAEREAAEREATNRREREKAARQAEIDRERARAEKEKSEQAAAAAAEAEAQAKAKVNAEKEAADRKAQAKPATNVTQPTAESYFASPEAESQHNEYLALHKKLKEFRRKFWEDAKQNKPLKTAVGEMRRAMRTSVGQLTDDRVGNKKAQERVKTNLLRALSEVPSPPIPVNEYLPPHLHHPENPSLPSLVIYLLSIFSKAIIAAFTAEVAVNPRAAEPIGTLTAQVFSMNELQLPNGKGTLIPILMAKFHAVAPVLFGISGPETTAAGRTRLGWRTELRGDTTGNKKSFVVEQRHHERMTGLGAGYASIALRNFSKTQLKNPFPPHHFWQSLSYIVNTPPQQVNTSHLLLLKSMLDNNAPDRFVLFFGNVGIAGLREALVEFPKRLPDKVASSPAARSIGLMVDGLTRERHIRLS